MSDTIAMTGAAGRIGTAVLPLLRRPGRRFVLTDSVPVEGQPEDEVRRLDVHDLPGLVDALEGVSTLVHLAGIPQEAEWAELLSANIDGTALVLDAAQQAGVERVMLASSIHAVGMWTLADARREETLLPRPEGFYGVSKAAMEALGSMYADRYGMSVVSARICAFGEEPLPTFGPTTWFSPADAARLIEAVHALRSPGHHIVWGVSAHGAEAFDLADGQGIGFHPVDRTPEAPEWEIEWGAPLAAEAALDRNPPGEPWS
jgi:nucleoside-diphosphate-sugar epimerase